jgi:hypothetical protein
VDLDTPEAHDAIVQILLWAQRNEDFSNFVRVLRRADKLELLRRLEPAKLSKAKAAILRSALDPAFRIQSFSHLTLSLSGTAAAIIVSGFLNVSRVRHSDGITRAFSVIGNRLILVLAVGIAWPVRYHLLIIACKPIHFRPAQSSKLIDLSANLTLDCVTI